MSSGTRTATRRGTDSNVISITGRNVPRAATSSPASGTQLIRESPSHTGGLHLSLSPIVPPAGVSKSSANRGTTKASTERPADLRIAALEVPNFIRGKSASFLKKTFPKAWAEHQTLSRKAQRAGADACTVHPAFRSFPDFLAEMGPAPSVGHTIDRIDNLNPTYGPGNCRWSTSKEQANNRSTNVRVSWKGQTRTLKEWSDLLRIPYERIKKRHQRGYNADRMFADAKHPTAPEAVAASTGTNLATVPEVSNIPTRTDELGWPIGIDRRAFETGYQHALKAMKVNERHFSRAYFAVWVLGSRHWQLRRAIMERLPAYFFQEQLDQDELLELRTAAASDPTVKQWMEVQGPLAAAFEAWNAELLSRQNTYSYPSTVDSHYSSMRCLWRDKPCTMPGELWRLVKPHSR